MALALEHERISNGTFFWYGNKGGYAAHEFLACSAATDIWFILQLLSIVDQVYSVALSLDFYSGDFSFTWPHTKGVGCLCCNWGSRNGGLFDGCQGVE